MRTRRIFTWALGSAVLLLGACTGTQRVASDQRASEYDDVYFAKSDRPVVEVYYATTNPEYGYDSYAASRSLEPVQSYSEELYGDDDFVYSRQIRRYEETSNDDTWRYYDPYYSNDLYYVMGTSAWDTWYGNGWYDWNRPRFGSSFSWSTGYAYGGSSIGLGFGTGGYYSPWNTYNAYNPWVSSYYGYSPYTGGYSYYGGFGGYSPFGGSAYYCPPTGTLPFNSWTQYSSSQNSAPRGSVSSGRSQTGYRPPTTTANSNSGRVGSGNTGRPNGTRTSSSRNYRPGRSDYTVPRYTDNAVTARSSRNVINSGGRRSRLNVNNRATGTTSRSGRNVINSSRYRTPANRSMGSGVRSSSPGRSTRMSSPVRSGGGSRMSAPRSGGGVRRR